MAGIFFSASYCGPCKQFIPLLEQFYNKMKQKGKSFEIIWVNSDTQASKNDFLEYYRLMPWPAVPFEVATDALMRTAHRYSLSGIPHLVIVHGDDCSVITLDGRMKVVEDPNGLEFPWGNRARSLIPVPRFVEKYIARKVKALRLSILSAIQPRALLYAVQSVALGVLRLVGAIASKLGSMFFA
jgi:nucleoredoxin